VNRADLRNAVRIRLGNPSAEGFFTDPVLNALVNEALQVVSAEEDWPWLQAATTFSTVAGTQAYSPPSDWARTKALIIDGAYPIEWLPLTDIRSIPVATTGAPTCFTVFAEELLLAPVPNGAYTVKHDYYVSEAALTAETDTPLLPASFHYAVVAKATELGHLRQRDIDRAGAELAEYNSWVVCMRTHLSRSSAPKRIRVRPGSAF
jgi:hypothetical protein